MIGFVRQRLTYANVVASLALFLAIAGGTAVALSGKNSVRSDDIARNAVKTADIAKNAVKTADIAKNAVNSAKLKDGGVREADLAPTEPYHLVGQPGEPGFGNGGENDCLWSAFDDPSQTLPGTLNPVSFYKDPFGRVHLAGVAERNNGPGGDATCDVNEASDSYIFTLPPAYRPANLELLPSAAGGSTAVVVAGTTDAIFSGSLFPAGTVVGLTDAAAMDGLSFRAAGGSNNLTRTKSASRPGISLSGLRRLLNK